jgi:hypothetical protein
MTGKRTTLLIKLQRLEASHRDALEAYNSTVNRTCMREVQETSQAIANKLRESEEMHGLGKIVDALMAAEQ